MKLLLKNFMDISKVEFDDSSDLILIVGDNGVGKTLFLESYTLANDIIREEITEKSFNELLKMEKFSFDEERIKDLNEDDRDLLTKYMYQTDINDVDILGKFFFNIKINDIEKVKTEFISFFKKIMLSIKDQIDSIVLRDSSSELEVEIDLDITNDLNNFLENSFSVYIIASSEFEIPKIIYRNHISDRIIEEDLIDSFEMSLFKESKEFSPKFVDEMFHEKIEYELKKSIVERLFNNFSKNNLKNFEEMSFLPSERNTSVVNDVVDKIEIRNGKLPIRYSEYNFFRNYTRYKEIEKIIKRNDFIRKNTISDDFEKLLDGRPIINDDGEIEQIELVNKKIINKNLFSTKQNKVAPLKMLDVPFIKGRYIIEEPEAHLSLKGLSDMADFLFYHLKQGKKMILSTHNDVFFSRINNLVKQNEDIKAIAYEIIQNEDEKLFLEVEKTEYGFKSLFISEQLNMLYDDTLRIQQGE